MSHERPVGHAAAAGVSTAPAGLPDQLDRELDDELLDLLCDDERWLDETFREIVAASWVRPPRRGRTRPAARPRRHRQPGVDGLATAGAGSQWSTRPRGRQRSPPR